MPVVATARRADAVSAARRLTVTLGAALLLGGCALPRSFEGEPLPAADAVSGKRDGYRPAAMLGRLEADGLRVVVTFSGGGIRASALAYGVLEQLAADRIRPSPEDAPRRLLDEVDLMSAVSGGAVPAAYFALYGDRLFEDFERRFLKRDISGALQRAIFLDPRNWLRLASTNYSRGDLYADWLDRKLFRGATYADLERDGRRLETVVTPRPVEGARGAGTIGRIDAAVGGPVERVTVRSGPADALVEGARRTWEVCALTLSMIGRMLTGDAALSNLSGPLTIADVAGQSASLGLSHYLAFLALVSVSLGVLNLLPLPMLDGGHLMYYLFEAVTGRPVPDIWLERLQRGGMALLVLLMSVALFNDVARLLGLQ